jgi:hypothetical protein
MVIVGFGIDVSSAIIISVNLIGVVSVGVSVGIDVPIKKSKVMIVNILYYFELNLKQIPRTA